MNFFRTERKVREKQINFDCVKTNHIDTNTNIKILVVGEILESTVTLSLLQDSKKLRIKKMYYKWHYSITSLNDTLIPDD